MCMAANRLSYFFNLSGPSIAMDTACSSTMVALHQAVRTLQHGDSGMALVCGAKLIITPNMFVPSTELGFLSPSGRSRSFDAEADGYGRGEGVIALLLKPLKAAVADGDPVRAIVKGTRLNQDGRTKGITLPSASAQRDNMEKLYSELGISPKEIQYLEAHVWISLSIRIPASDYLFIQGTGTAGGDKLEFCAIHAVFGRIQRSQPLIVGALKSCIGHLEACAGLASVVKTIECLERGQIPPQMHFKKPNPNINFQDVEIPLTMLDWPTNPGEARRAAINTFGAGGTNAHAVLESFTEQVKEALLARKSYLFMVSAADDQALRRLCLNYADYTEQHKPELFKLAHTLLACRSKLGFSISFAASNHVEVALKLRNQTARIVSVPRKALTTVVFLFTGQGAQW
jgi:acyl transferase domain-containing protein